MIKKHRSMIGFPITPIENSNQLFSHLDQSIMSKTGLSVFNLNIRGFNFYHRNRVFQQAVNEADVILCDSDFLRQILKRLDKVYAIKQSGSRWFTDYLKNTQCNDLKIFLLGDKESVLAKSATFLTRFKKDIQVEYHHGFFNAETQHSIIKSIQAFSPDILIVGMGMPIQEKFLYENRNHFSSIVTIPIGGAFLYWAGIYKQAPAIIIRLHLEWLHRIIQDPQRLMGRYLRDGFDFLSILVKYLTKTSDVFGQSSASDKKFPG